MGIQRSASALILAKHFQCALANVGMLFYNAGMKAVIAAFAILLAGCAGRRGESYVMAHPELDAETKRRILANEAVEGMTADQVRASLGAPDGVRRQAYGVDYWEYRSAFLVFRDGVLVSWIDKKSLY